MDAARVSTLAEFVRERLDRLGITQADLAARAELSKSEVNAIVQGRVKLPGPDKRRRLARALGVLPYELLVAAGEYDPVLDGAPPATPDAAPPDPVKARYMAMLAALRMDEAAVMVLEANLPALLRHQARTPIPAAGLADGDEPSPSGAAAAPAETPAPRRAGRSA